MLHGKGYNRWFDKSFNMIFTKNGRVRHNQILKIKKLLRLEREMFPTKGRTQCGTFVGRRACHWPHVGNNIGRRGAPDWL